MYDTFASEYGYTIDEFLSLTMRQCLMLLKIIHKRKFENSYNAMLSYAVVHGVKLKPLSEITEEEEIETNGIDEKSKAILDRHGEEILKRMHGRQ